RISRFLTGLGIHPGAKIGRRLFIDHGAGVDIGDTCEIDESVRLWQGRPLVGADQPRGKRRRPLEARILVESGVEVLDGIRIAKNSKVGGGYVVLKDVLATCTVVGIPGRIVKQNGKKVSQKPDHNVLPDPILDRIKRLEDEIDDLKKAYGHSGKDEKHVN